MNIGSITVTDISGAFTVYSPSGRYENMISRASYGLSLCKSGQITYIQDGREYVSSPERAVILPKGQSYSIRGDKEGLFPVINFDCSEDLCDTVEEIDIENPEQLIHSFEQIKQLILQGGSRAKIFSIFYDMLSKLHSERVMPELVPAISYINENYGDLCLTNAAVAAECRISEVYFRKLFTKQFGISPKQYVIDIRIEHAKQMLSEGIMKICAISESCGFASPYHFCRIFKQRVGVTPSEYRKKNKICKI